MSEDRGAAMNIIVWECSNESRGGNAVKKTVMVKGLLLTCRR